MLGLSRLAVKISEEPNNEEHSKVKPLPLIHLPWYKLDVLFPYKKIVAFHIP
jgi:hypothetical protein